MRPDDVPDASGPADDDDFDRPAPGPVVAAVALGCAPLPIIAVYTIIFLVHGSVHPVQPPDVTGSKQGEFVVGCICLVLFVAGVTGLLWLLNGRRRWPFALVELVILALAVDFVVDRTTGGTTVSVLVAIAAAVSLICAFAPQAWRHVRRPAPRIVESVYGAGGRRGRIAAYRGDSST